MPSLNPIYDAIIIGGGPAGLTGAIYLARFRRHTLVIDAGQSRATWVPVSHNHAGFPDGINGVELLRRMRTQAELYGALIEHASVETLEKKDEIFHIQTNTTILLARTILLATGVVDVKPDLPNLPEAVYEGLIRYCPVCDAYEAIDKRIVVLGHGASGFGEANFLTDYSSHVSVTTAGEAFERHDKLYKTLVAKGVHIVEEPVSNLTAGQEVDPICITLAGGKKLSFDTAYAAIGCRPRNVLATQIGAALGEDHRLKVDDHQETSIPGCFAAGDIVHGFKPD
jgi:thioredoxin reductase (NADPH)